MSVEEEEFEAKVRESFGCLFRRETSSVQSDIILLETWPTSWLRLSSPSLVYSKVR